MCPLPLCANTYSTPCQYVAHLPLVHATSAHTARLSGLEESQERILSPLNHAQLYESDLLQWQDVHRGLLDGFAGG